MTAWATAPLDSFYT